jgi:hypothetical protein
MKIRKGFVSNSSSSSFICEVCGYNESGYDIDMSEYDMISCKNGHIVCLEHLKNKDFNFEDVKEALGLDEDIHESLIKEIKNIKDLLKLVKFLIDEEVLENYDIPECLCPICKFDYVSDSDFKSYVTKNHITEESVIKEIKSKFSSYKDFKKGSK